jgi:hypothetical protein
VKPPQAATPEWTGLCATDEICASAFTTHTTPLRVTLSVAQSDEVPPYVEIYADEALVAEGEVRDRRTFEITAGPSLQRTEIRIANPRTRGGFQRRLRLMS